jgi:hypothetical protein
MERVGIVKVAAEVDPGHPPQEIRQGSFLRHLCVGKQDRNDTKGRVTRAFIQRQPHFLIFPRSQIRRAKKHGTGPALVERLFQLFLPGISGDEMPFVQERFQLCFCAEPPGNSLDRVFVSAGVGEEDIIALCGCRVSLSSHSFPVRTTGGLALMQLCSGNDRERLWFSFQIRLGKDR